MTLTHTTKHGHVKHPDQHTPVEPEAPSTPTPVGVAATTGPLSPVTEMSNTKPATTTQPTIGRIVHVIEKATLEPLTLVLRAAIITAVYPEPDDAFVDLCVFRPGTPVTVTRVPFKAPDQSGVLAPNDLETWRWPERGVAPIMPARPVAGGGYVAESPTGPETPKT